MRRAETLLLALRASEKWDEGLSDEARSSGQLYRELLSLIDWIAHVCTPGLSYGEKLQIAVQESTSAR